MPETQVEGISANYNMGLVPITNVTKQLLMFDITQYPVAELAMKHEENQQGFNSVYMMLGIQARVQKNISSVNWYAWFDG
jgi:hypothetical protein